jgi:hypothetical protein
VNIGTIGGKKDGPGRPTRGGMPREALGHEEAGVEERRRTTRCTEPLLRLDARERGGMAMADRAAAWLLS